MIKNIVVVSGRVGKAKTTLVSDIKKQESPRVVTIEVLPEITIKNI
jgi:MoxR-like ATPase